MFTCIETLQQPYDSCAPHAADCWQQNSMLGGRASLSRGRVGSDLATVSDRSRRAKPRTGSMHSHVLRRSNSSTAPISGAASSMSSLESWTDFTSDVLYLLLRGDQGSAAGFMESCYSHLATLFTRVLQRSRGLL